MLDKSKKYIIVGIIKSGTTSAFRFYKSQGYDILKDEVLATHPNGIEKYKKEYAGRIPLIITRNKVQRLVSHIRYFPKFYPEKVHPGMSPADFCNANIIDEEFGDLNPLRCSNDEKLAMRWKEFQPITLRLEDLQEEPDFPHFNKGKYEKDEHLEQFCREKLELYLRMPVA